MPIDITSSVRLQAHKTAARGHLRANVNGNPRACFEVDEPMKAFDYGRFDHSMLILRRLFSSR